MAMIRNGTPTRGTMPISIPGQCPYGDLAPEVEGDPSVRLARLEVQRDACGTRASR
jgi:hypothetical protein